MLIINYLRICAKVKYIIPKYKASTVTAYRFPISAGYQQLPPIIVKGTNDISSNDSTR